MKKIIHKIAGLALGLSLAMGVGVVLGSHDSHEVKAAASYEFSGTEVVFANQGLTNSVQYIEQAFSSSDFSVQFGGGGNDGKYYTTGSGMRVYGGGYFTVTGISGTITGLEFAWDGSYKPSDSSVASEGTFNSPFTNWSGSATSVTFTRPSGSGHWRLKSVTATISAASEKTVTNLVVSGSMSKTEYTSAEQWSPAGLTVTATFDDSSSSDVTSSATWTYDPASPSVSVTSVIATANYGGQQGSSSAQTVTVTAAPGSEDLPYTVAQARAAIDAGSGVNNVYATGIVSAIPTAYSTQYKNITFNLVDNEGDQVFLQAFRCAGTDAANVAVGDTAVVLGNLKLHNNTIYEFDSGCTLISLEHPVVSTTYEVTFDSNGGSNIPEGRDVGEGLTFQFPSAGTLDDHIFLGWSSDGGEHYYQEGDTSVAVIDDIEYTAYWATKGAEADPYSVSEAIAAIDGNYGLKNIHVSGIISQVDSFSSGVITYWISEDGSTNNQFEVYKGKNIGNENFTAKEDVEVGASVTVFGNIKKYNTTYEFDSGNYLVAYAAPSHQLTGIALSGTYQTSFEQGAVFNYEGLVVTASYDGAADKEVTPTSVSSPDMNVLGEQEVTVSYSEEEVTKTASYTITITAPVAKHTVSFNHGDGTGEMDSVLVNDGASYDLPECTFIAPEGKVFAGWTLNGTDKVTALESVTADVEVTALWEDAPEETTVAYIFSEHYAENTTIDGEVIALDGAVSVTFNKREGGTATQYYTNGEAVRWYGGGTLLIESSSGAITSIVITFKGGHSNNVTANVGTYEESIDSSSGTGTWSGNSSSVLFTQAGTSGNDRISQISVTYSGSSVPPSPVSYTVTYSANGGTGNLEDSNSPYQSGTSVTTLENSFTRDGYAFIEWNTSADGNGTSYAEGATFNINGNTTLYAIWEQNGGGGSVVAGRCYSLVEDESELVAGAKYVIAASNDNGDYAMSTTQNNNNRAKEEIEISNGVAVVSSDAVQVVTLSGSEGAWNFGVSGGYLYASSSSSNQLKTEAEIDDNGNANWAITFSNGIASIVAQGTSTRKVMQYNAGSSLFACYASNSQTEVSLYRLDFEATLLHNITCDGNGSHTFADGYSWSDLEVVYGDLPEAEKSALAAIEEPVADSGLERYDYLVAKYEFKNFISRDVTYVGMAPVVYHVGESNTSTIIIVVVALTSITSIGVLLVIKRRRTLMK